jgi:hypothetical protein
MDAAPSNVQRDARRQITVLVVAALKQTVSVSNGVQIADHLLDALRAVDAESEGGRVKVDTHSDV